MKVIKAEQLYSLAQLSGSIGGLVEGASTKDRELVVVKSTKDRLAALLEGKRSACEEASLRISVLAIDELLSDLQINESLQYEDLKSALNELANTVRRELLCATVLCLNPKRSEFYDGKNLFGDEVATNFPSTAFDIVEAGNCLATERSTAVVFHLVRVLEVGLRALGKTLNAPHLDANRNPTWESILTRCDAELKKPRKDRSPDWQANEDFYTEATARLRSVKDAWRNPTMHVDKKYTPDEAQDIYNAARTFMRHLASRLQE